MSSLIWLQMFVLDEQKVHKNLPVCVCVCVIYDPSSASAPHSITCVIFTAGWAGGGLYTPCKGSDKHLLTERNANKLLRRRTVQGGGVRMGGGCGLKKGKGKREKTPLLPLCLVNSPPRRLIRSLPEQCRGGPATWWPYGLQMAPRLLTVTPPECRVVEDVAEAFTQRTFVVIWFMNINNLWVFPKLTYSHFNIYSFFPQFPVVFRQYPACKRSRERRRRGGRNWASEDKRRQI